MSASYFFLTVVAAGFGLLAWRRSRELRREGTARAAAEDALRWQAVVFDTIGDAVLVFEVGGVIVGANSAAESLLGYTREELVGQMPSLWQRADEFAQRSPIVRAALKAEGSWAGEFIVIRKDGTSRTVESSVRTITDFRTCRTVQVVGVLRDVSEQRHLEAQLLQAQKLEAIGSLAAGIAHEINTPLQYVGDNVRFLGEGMRTLRQLLDHAQLIAERSKDSTALSPLVAGFHDAMRTADLEYLDEQLPGAAANAQDGCARVNEIVQALKRFAHPGSKNKDLTDINASIESTIAVCRNEWKYVATVSANLDATLPFVPCLRAELQQTLLNLIINAAQAIGDARASSGTLGHIAISSRQDDAWVEIRVADDGPGIPAAIAPRIFDPFFTTKAPGRGTGQGLSIGYATIVGKHQGTLTFESVEGQGATFTIRIPLDSEMTLPSAA